MSVAHSSIAPSAALPERPAPSRVPPLRVAWLAPYDLRQFGHRFDPPLRGQFHNAPWISNGTRALVDSAAVDLHLVTYDKRIEHNLTFIEDGVTFHLIRTPMPRVPRAALLYQLDVRPFLRTLDAIGPDLVHGHGTENIYSYVAVRSRYPHVISMQAVISELVRTHRSFSRAWCEQSLVRLVERSTLKRARCVFVEAPFVESLIRPLNPAMTVRLAGNIVSHPFFAVRRSSDQAAAIMFVGRLAQTKGVEEIVCAFHRVAASEPALELHLVGQGDAAYVGRRLQPLIEAGPAPRRVIMCGHLTAEQIAAEYARAAMVVLPTYYDTSPNVIAEAMVAGVPVVATTVGGLPYMLDNGANGRLVPPRDVGALADAIASNLRQPDEAAACAARAQQVARVRYGSDLFVRRMLHMYQRVLSNPLGDGSGIALDDEHES